MLDGSEKKWQIGLPTTVTASVADPNVVQLNGVQADRVRVKPSRALQILPRQLGQTEVRLKLFGALPIKTFKVQVVPNIKVIPGGQSIGVKLTSDGMLVVGHHRVKGETGDSSPGQQADIRIGDRILNIEGITITSPEQMNRLIQVHGKKQEGIVARVARGEKQFDVTIHPLYDKANRSYRIGLYVKNATSGVGTLTFYAPDTHLYGALGHVISDLDTGSPIVVGKGQIVQSNVTAVEKGISGKPGEKRAIFFNEKDILGNIKKNTPFGIFGEMDQFPENGYTNEAIPIGLMEDVKTGPAHIYTVVEGRKVEKYDIEIVNVIKQPYAATKGLIIKVTDERLLQKTGGIVQGMSGSPIIQDGKLVGAVTHVFVNDPTSGYGTYIEWMLQEVGIKLSTVDVGRQRKPHINGVFPIEMVFFHIEY